MDNAIRLENIYHTLHLQGHLAIKRRRKLSPTRSIGESGDSTEYFGRENLGREGYYKQGKVIPKSSGRIVEPETNRRIDVIA